MVTRLAPTGTPQELAAVGYDGTTWDRPRNLARGQLTTLERMPSVELGTGPAVLPLPVGEPLDVAALGYRDPLTGAAMTGDQFLDRRLYTDALAVISNGRLVYETYRNSMTEHDRHVCHSCSKTMTTMMVGIAVDEGRLDPTRPMRDYVEELAAIPAWQDITLQHVLDMATGLDTEEHYQDADSMYWRYADAVGYYTGREERGIGVLRYAQEELTRLVEPPGSRFNYASYLTNLLPIAVERAYGVPAVDLYEDRIYRHLGAEQPALINVDSAWSPIVEGQVNLTLRDFARWGLLLLTGGRALDGRQVVPEAWIADTFASDPARAEAFARSEYGGSLPGAEYHNQTWVPEPGRVALMLGIHGQYCYADRLTNTLIVGYSSFPDQSSELLMATLQELWVTIGSAIADA